MGGSVIYGRFHCIATWQELEQKKVAIYIIGACWTCTTEAVLQWLYVGMTHHWLRNYLIPHTPILHCSAATIFLPTLEAPILVTTWLLFAIEVAFTCCWKKTMQQIMHLTEGKMAVSFTCSHSFLFDQNMHGSITCEISHLPPQLSYGKKCIAFSKFQHLKLLVYICKAEDACISSLQQLQLGNLKYTFDTIFATHRLGVIS